MSDEKPRVVTELEMLTGTPMVELRHWMIKSVCDKAVVAIGMLMSERDSIQAELAQVKAKLAEQTKIINENDQKIEQLETKIVLALEWAQKRLGEL